MTNSNGISMKERASDVVQRIRSWRPSMGTLISLAVALLLVFSFYGFFAPLLQITQQIAMVIVFALVCIALLVHLIKVRPHISVALPFIFYLIFFVLIIVNNNIDLQDFIYGSSTRLNGTGLAWFLVFGGTLLSAIYLCNVTTPNWQEIVLKCIALFGLFYGCFTIIFWIFPSFYDLFYPTLLEISEVTSINGEGYKAGLTTHYSKNGAFIALGLIAAFCLTLKNRRSYFWAISSCVLLLALVLTTKRGDLIYSVLALVFVYLLLNSRHLKHALKYLLIVVVIAAVFLLIYSLFDSSLIEVFVRIFEGLASGDLNGRESMWELCIEMWQEHPFFGNGWGSFTQAYNQTASAAYYVAGGYTDIDAHNVYLEVLAEEGLVGLIVFVAALATGIVISVRELLRLNKAEELYQEERVYVATSLAVQVFFALMAITANPLYDYILFIPYLLSLAMTFAVIRRVNKSKIGEVPLDSSMQQMSVDDPSDENYDSETAEDLLS